MPPKKRTPASQSAISVVPLIEKHLKNADVVEIMRKAFNVPAKGDAVDNIGKALVKLIMDDVIPTHAAELVDQLQVIFAADDDEIVSQGERWLDALHLNDFYRGVNFTASMLRSNILATAFEIALSNLEPSERVRLSALLRAPRVIGDGLDPTLEGLLDHLVPPDQEFKRRREELGITQACDTPAGAGTRAAPMVDDAPSESESGSASGSGSGSSSGSESGSASDDDAADGAAAEADEDPANDPLASMPDDDLKSRKVTVQQLKDYLRKLGVSTVPKTATKGQLADMVLEKRKK